MPAEEEVCVPEPKNTTQNKVCKASRSQGTQATISVCKPSRSQRTQATVSTSKKGTQCLLRFTSSTGSQTKLTALTRVEVGSARQDGPWEPASSLLGGVAWGPGREQPGNGIFLVAPSGGGRPTGDSTAPQVEAQLCVGSESTLPTADAQAQAIVRLYACSSCRRTYDRLVDLQSHMWAVHGSVQCFTCALCRESFGTRHGLAEHERWHARGEPRSCSLCPELLLDRAQMVQHQREHAGEKPFVCGVCGKGFVKRLHVASHQRHMHGGERPHVCGVCGKGFVQKSHLAKHTKMHGREMPHQCRTCHQRFPYRFYLVSHEMSHSGQELQGEGGPGSTAHR